MKATWEILPGKIWQGNLFSLASGGFDACISCTRLSEVANIVGNHFPVHTFFPFADAAKLPDLVLLQAVAMGGAEMAGKRLLVTCNAGCNRSGLVIGVILRLLNIKDPVGVIKAAHPEALYRQTFVDYLNKLE